MKKQEFHAALAQYLNDDACGELLDDENLMQDVPDAPYGNFFGDDFFTLLHHSAGPCVASLREVKASLKMVIDHEQSRHLRAQAAVTLGRFVQDRHQDGDGMSGMPGTSPPRAWFALAREMGSVIGALAFANSLLAEEALSVQFDLNVDPLPRIMPPVGAQKDVVLTSVVSQAWYLGARVAARHVPRHFEGWGLEDFCCALACVVNYLVLRPERTYGFARPPVPPRQALVWVRPLWNALIRCAPLRVAEPEAYRAALIDQQCAVYLHVDDLEHGRIKPNTSVVLRPEQAPTAAVEENQVVVIRGEIPSANDKGEKEYLKLYEPLRAPMDLSPLPDRARLAEIQHVLEAEFPWATEAIGVIMSDLLARRRHGVVRLGLSPILLVGQPGTGKTHLAQRLSGLLGTPNTVINLAGMSDVKLLKGVTRGWASNRPSRMLEFIQQAKVANPLFVLDEIDKAGGGYSNGGDPQDALLDLLEPGNAKRYQDIYLMTECDLSHCLYIATSNSLERLPEPLLSRLRPVYFPPPGPEHAQAIIQGVLGDMARAWGLPRGALTVTPPQIAFLRGLAPREMRRALLAIFGHDADTAYTLH